MNMTNTQREAKRREQVEARAEYIAKQVFNLDDLKERKRDRLDFHDLHVSSLRTALVLAYEMGRRDAEGDNR